MFRDKPKLVELNTKWILLKRVPDNDHQNSRLKENLFLGKNAAMNV